MSEQVYEIDSSIKERITKCVFDINTSLGFAVDILKVLPPIHEAAFIIDNASDVCMAAAIVLKEQIIKIEKDAANAKLFLNSYIAEVKDKKIYERM